MINEFINKTKDFIIRIDIINGTYWADDVVKIIEEKIKPSNIEKKTIKISWDYSEYEIHITKDNINFNLNINDDTFGYIILKKKITEENKQKLREWATIIDSEMEKLK